MNKLHANFGQEVPDAPAGALPGSASASSSAEAQVDQIKSKLEMQTEQFEIVLAERDVERKALVQAQQVWLLLFFHRL